MACLCLTNENKGTLLEMFEIHESVYRDTIMKVTNKMQLYRLIYYS